MACGCNKKATVNTNGVAVAPNTYRVIVSGRQVYESSNPTAADTVAGRFDNAKVLAPGVAS